MKNVYLTAFAFLFLLNNSFSQGIIFDSAQFAQREAVKISRSPLPKAYSLKKYTPNNYPQVGSTCVGHSFATARTILAAKSMGLTDKQKITGMSFSPYYIYYRNKFEGDVNCNAGLNVEQAAKDVLQNGFAPLADVEYPYYYPFTKQTLCMDKNGTDYPPSMQEDEQVASKYKIDQIYAITTLAQLKTALSKGMPVVVILFPPPSFTAAKTDLWTSPPTEFLNRNTMAHAVLAVGYDDIKYGGCVEIMNSWGDTWGNKGFLSVKYQDYQKFFVGGYAFYMKDYKTPVKNIPAPVTNKLEPKVPEKKESIPLPKSIDASPAPTTINVRKGYGKGTIPFNNSAILKAFKK